MWSNRGQLPLKIRVRGGLIINKQFKCQLSELEQSSNNNLQPIQNNISTEKWQIGSADVLILGLQVP